MPMSLGRMMRLVFLETILSSDAVVITFSKINTTRGQSTGASELDGTSWRLVTGNNIVDSPKPNLQVGKGTLSPPTVSNRQSQETNRNEVG